MDDCLCDIAFYDDMSVGELTSYFLKTTNGRRAYHPNVHVYRARWVRLSCPQAFSSVSDKDELVDKKVLKIEVVSAALRMIVGQGAALTLPADVVTAAPPLSGDQPARKNGHNGTQAQDASTEAVPQIGVHSQS